MIEFVQITAQYSNAVLLAVVPYVSHFAHKLDLPGPQPITAGQVLEFRCDPRKGQIGGLLTLTNGARFSFVEGHVSSYRSPLSYFSLQGPELIPSFYGLIKVKETDAMRIARSVIKRLGYREALFHAERAPRVTRPEKIGADRVARYRFQWLDPDWQKSPKIAGITPALLDVEVDATSGRIQMVSLAGPGLQRPTPHIDVSPPLVPAAQSAGQAQLSGGTRTEPVSPQYAAAFLQATLPQCSAFAAQIELHLPLPLTTNSVDSLRYYCGLLEKQPIAQIYLRNGDRFNYEHGRVTAFYAHDAYHKFPEQGRLEDFLGKVNITTNAAIALCERAITNLGYKAKLPKAFLGTVTHLGGQQLTRCVFYWFRPGEDSNFATFEVDMQKSAIKAAYLDDPSLWRDPPKISVPTAATTNAHPQ